MNMTPSDNTGGSLTVSIDCLKNDIGKIVVFPLYFSIMWHVLCATMWY